MSFCFYSQYEERERERERVRVHVWSSRGATFHGGICPIFSSPTTTADRNTSQLSDRRVEFASRPLARVVFLHSFFSLFNGCSFLFEYAASALHELADLHFQNTLLFLKTMILEKSEKTNHTKVRVQTAHRTCARTHTPLLAESTPERSESALQKSE